MRNLATIMMVASLLLCGVVSPSHAKISHSSPVFFAQEQSKGQKFYGKIVSQNGVRFILRDDENNVWYHLDDQQKASALFGKDVLVTGTFDGVAGAIHVQNIVEAGPQDRPRPTIEDKNPSEPLKNNTASPSNPDRDASNLPPPIPAPELRGSTNAQPPRARASVDSPASGRSESKVSASPVRELSTSSFFSMSEEPVSASSTVAVSARRFIPASSGSSTQTEVPRNLVLGRLLRHVDPVYPRDAREQRIEGTVRLRAVIGEDGAVESVETVSGPPPLVEAATVAVREWRYSPTLLNGHRVQIQEEIRVLFRLPG